MRIVAVILAVMTTTVAHAAEYPTVRDIENGLRVSPGVQLPRDIPAREKVWHVFYVGAKAIGNGEYDVRVRLR
jgi:hypothetical protein